MKIEQRLLTLDAPSARHGRTGKPLNSIGVLVHYVGNPGSQAINNRNYFESGSNGNYVSAHYIVGLQGEVIQCVPENERAAHAGKSYAAQYNELAKTNNSQYLGIETCHPDTSGKFSSVTRVSLVELVADICLRHNFDPYNHVLRHYDVTGKSCPLYYVNKFTEWCNLRTAFEAGILIALCDKHGTQIDLPYWEGIVAGTRRPDPQHYEWVKILRSRLAAK